MLFSLNSLVKWNMIVCFKNVLGYRQIIVLDESLNVLFVL